MRICLLDKKIRRKIRFETSITGNDVRVLFLFNLVYLTTLMAYLCSRRATNVEIKYFVSLVDLQTICAKYELES
jgi:hypothetical protein